MNYGLDVLKEKNKCEDIKNAAKAGGRVWFLLARFLTFALSVESNGSGQYGDNLVGVSLFPLNQNIVSCLV